LNIHKFSDIINQFYEFNLFHLSNYIKILYQIDNYYSRFSNIRLILLKKIIDINSQDHENISIHFSQPGIYAIICNFIQHIHQLKKLFK
jgi:hypothetical protein